MSGEARPPRLLEAAYGGKTGFALLQISHMQYRLGRLERWEKIDFSRVRRLVFVCKGNISRSPYAQAQSVKRGFPAVSFGIAATDGSPAETQALENARRRGVDLSQHRATNLGRYRPRQQDLVLCYETAQAEHLEAYVADGAAAGTAAQVSLMGLWSLPRRPLIFDPYGLHDRYYQTCYATIDSALEHVLISIAGGRTGV